MSTTSPNFTVSAFESVSGYMVPTFLKIPSSDSITNAAKKMLEANATEAIVCNDANNPIGIVTERDVLYRVVAAGKDPTSTKVLEIMSAPIVYVDENAPIAEPLLKMHDLRIRRIGVKREGQIIGLITQNSIVSKASERGT